LIAGLIVAIFSVTAAARRIKVDRLTQWGVLVEGSADIREGPGEDFDRIEIGHEGLEFKILDERENSYLVELKNGLKGWIDKETVLKI
jgi:SH3-like domain-containing protein